MSDETPAAAPPVTRHEAAPSVAFPSTATGRSGPAASPSCRRPTSGLPIDCPSPKCPYPKPGPRARRWTGAPSNNERALYGDLLPDVVLLRQRGFGVHREGEFFRVGNRLLDADGLKTIAARERRLLEPLPQPT